MRPKFKNYDVSPICHRECEWAYEDSPCDCKQCGGVNHGRMRQDTEFNRANNHKCFYDNHTEINVWQNGPLRWFTVTAA